MIGSLKTLVAGVAIAVMIIVVAVLAAIGIIGLATKAALFGEPRATLATKVYQRLTDITQLTPNSTEDK